MDKLTIMTNNRHCVCLEIANYEPAGEYFRVLVLEPAGTFIQVFWGGPDLQGPCHFQYRKKWWYSPATLQGTLFLEHALVLQNGQICTRAADPCYPFGKRLKNAELYFKDKTFEGPCYLLFETKWWFSPETLRDLEEII